MLRLKNVKDSCFCQICSSLPWHDMGNCSLYLSHQSPNLTLYPQTPSYPWIHSGATPGLDQDCSECDHEKSLSTDVHIAESLGNF